MSGVPLRLYHPQLKGLYMRATHVHLTEKGAEITYTMPFDTTGVVLRPQLIEVEFHSREKNPIQTIVEQGKYECGPAALAMCTGHTLFNVKRAAGRHGWRNDSSGIGSEASHGCVQDLGFEMIYLNRWRLALLDDVPSAILTVPSLNYKGKWHAVAWVGGEILDPNHGHPTRKTYGPEWNPHTIGCSGAEILLKPMTKIQYEDMRTMLMRDHKDLHEAIRYHAA